MDLNSCKYGFCSYFALAKTKDNPSQEVAFIEEWDEEMEKHYFVHFAIYHKDKEQPFEDALGCYDDLMDMLDFTDVIPENCRFTIWKASQIKDFIIKDMGFFDDNIYNEIVNLIETLK